MSDALRRFQGRLPETGQEVAAAIESGAGIALWSEGSDRSRVQSLLRQSLTGNPDISGISNTVLDDAIPLLDAALRRR